MLSDSFGLFSGLFSRRAPWLMLPLLLVCGRASAAPTIGTPAETTAKLPIELRASYISSVQTDAATSPAYRIDPATHTAKNPQQKLTTQLSAAGIRLAGTEVGSSGGPAFHAALGLSSYGCADHPVAARPVLPRVADNRVEYDRGGLTEWYVNGPLGVEQGFTLTAAPHCKTDHELVFTLTWDTDLSPALVHATDAAECHLELRDGVGKVRLTYSDLYAYDAMGKQLPAQLLLNGRQLALHVNDQGAQYPITIDPLIWAQQSKLLASDGISQDTFGSSVAISGDTAIIGDPQHDYNYTNQGAAYVFVRSGGQWTQQQRLLAADGFSNYNFGAAVAIAGDTVVVGAPSHFGAATGSGQAYVFVRSGTTWTEQTRLTATGAAANDNFGRSVAVDADTIVVGAPFADLGTVIDTGAAYVFFRTGTIWTQQQKLNAMDALASDAFGSVVAVSGNTTIIGAPKDDTVAGTDAGSAYVFLRTGTTWAQQMQLFAMDAAAGDQFASAVALATDTALIGAPLADPAALTNAGAAYAFFRTGTTWAQQQKFAASDGRSGDNLGSAVGIFADTAVIGSSLADPALGGTDSGAAYVWTRNGVTWTQQMKLVATDAAMSDQFGGAVAVSTDAVIAGAAQRYESGIKKGAAYAFFRGQATGDSCTLPSQCVSNLCINNTCRSGKLQGASCLSPGECATNFCVDGVCCDTACGDGQPDCQACSIGAGGSATGTCTLTPGKVCRTQVGECDVAEYCEAANPLCPRDTGIGDGMPCAFGTCRAGLCQGDAPLAYVPQVATTGCTLVTTHGTSQATAALWSLLVLVLLRRARRGVA